MASRASTIGASSHIIYSSLVIYNFTKSFYHSITITNIKTTKKFIEQKFILTIVHSRIIRISMVLIIKYIAIQGLKQKKMYYIQGLESNPKELVLEPGPGFQEPEPIMEPIFHISLNLNRNPNSFKFKLKIFIESLKLPMELFHYFINYNTIIHYIVRIVHNL